MPHDELRWRAEARVRELERAIGLPVPFEADALVDRLERHRGRPIDLYATTSTAGGTCGMWIRERARDVIVYAAQTSGFHQEHIILHEIGHMIAEHTGECVLSVADAASLAPHVRPELVEHLLARSAYTTEQEREAELIASLLWQRASMRGAQVTDRPLPPEVAQRMARVEDIFGF